MTVVVGQTKDVGFQIGVSKTVPYPVETVWAYLTSAEGIAVWLGEGVRLGTEKGARYETAEGTVGEVRSFHDNERLRLTWRPRDWDHDTTMQVTVTDSDGRTVLRFHQEWLADGDERLRQREHWRAVLLEVLAGLSRGRSPG
ncbi:SRPBCC family protein [Prauserella cavernicola]|uniref:SRPBCC domain-containing protein n=1 Tax=Prauserella cavernicola TaxID=2800127 RepID=A0A934V6B7_9PSEU|nr:SRPBCC domain-containing protein [Prauserella cavernicola]MBK1785518.1 SRPBCC domain-containing protein [Prauserella cavernicola]